MTDYGRKGHGADCEYKREVCLIAHIMRKSDRTKWKEVFEILSKGSKDEEQLKRDVWKVMQN